MSSAEFVANLSGMMDGQDFPKEMLKVWGWVGGGGAPYGLTPPLPSTLDPKPPPPKICFHPFLGAVQLHPQREAAMGSVSMGCGMGNDGGIYWDEL